VVAPLRVVSKLPLDELWNEAGTISATKVGPVGTDEIRKLLRSAPVRFVVADVSEQLRWVEGSDSFDWWKSELKPRLAEPEGAKAGVDLDEWPDGYGYVAYEWRLEDGAVVIAAEKWH
jgi:hypothetical protein